ALTLLVSAVPPTSAQLALLSDLAADPGGIAALVAGGSVAPPGHREPASIDLSGGPAGSDNCTARLWPLQLEARPQPLADADYVALTSLFATATEDYDIAPADPPYDTWTWPPDLAGPGALPADLADMPAAPPYATWTWPPDLAGPGELPADLADLTDDPDPDLADPSRADPSLADPELTGAGLAAGDEPAQLGPHWAQPPEWATDLGWATD